MLWPWREHKHLTVTMRLLITLIILAMTQLLLNMAHASPHTPVNANHHKVDSNTTAREDERRKRRPVKTSSGKAKEASNKKSRQTTVNKFKIKKRQPVNETAKKASPKRSLTVYKRRYHGNHMDQADEQISSGAPLKLSRAHRARYQKARETAMTKLIGQLGKPYQWGGTSPKTGFDCSGLVWYAYKDLVKFKIPRTANEMYHLRDAASIKRDDLEKGDLVFFRINGRGTADHVGVYLGNGKFIQSPRTGKDIQVSALSEDYWQRHYIGARRMMTPKTIR